MFKLPFFSHTEGLIQLAKSQHIQAMADLTTTAFAATYRDPDTGKGCFNADELQELKDNVLTHYPNLLADPKHVLLVAEKNNQVAGYAKLVLREDGVFLDRIYVLPAEQAKGYGNQLLLACFEQTMKQFKKTTMTLEVWDKNGKAIDYYHKNGFTITSKTHSKTAASGITYYGFEMICADVDQAHHHLSVYLNKKKEHTPFTL